MSHTHTFIYCLNCGDVEEQPASGLACSCRGAANIIIGRLSQAEWDEWQEYKQKPGKDWLAFRQILLDRAPT